MQTTAPRTRWESLQALAAPPLSAFRETSDIWASSCSPSGRICLVVLVMRKGGESSWSGLWHLGCTLEVFHVHSYQDQFLHPGWAECFLIFSLGLYFVYSFVLL